MSTRIHPKNVHKNSPKKRTSRKQNCQRKFAHFEKKCPLEVIVHEMYPSQKLSGDKSLLSLYVPLGLQERLLVKADNVWTFQGLGKGFEKLHWVVQQLRS